MLIFSDVHGGNRRLFATMTKEGLNSRFVDVLEVVRGIARYADKTRQRSIVCLGDVFESPGETIHKDVLVWLHNAFRRLASNADNVYILSGNHDLYRGRSVLTVFDDIPNVRVVSEPSWITIEGYDCAFVPFIRNVEELRDTLKQIDEEAKGLIDPLLFGHFDIKDINVGRPGQESRTKKGINMNEIPFEPFKEVFLGHIHRPSDSGNIHIVGSILQTVRSESGDLKRLFTFNDGQLKEIKLGGPKFHIVEICGGDFNEFEAMRNDSPEDFYDLVLKDPVTGYILPRDYRVRIIRDYGSVREERMDVKRADSQRDLLIKYLEGLDIDEKAKELALRIFDKGSGA